MEAARSGCLNCHIASQKAGGGPISLEELKSAILLEDGNSRICEGSVCHTDGARTYKQLTPLLDRSTSRLPLGRHCETQATDTRVHKDISCQGVDWLCLDYGRETRWDTKLDGFFASFRREVGRRHSTRLDPVFRRQLTWSSTCTNECAVSNLPIGCPESDLFQVFGALRLAELVEHCGRRWHPFWWTGQVPRSKPSKVTPISSEVACGRAIDTSGCLFFACTLHFCRKKEFASARCVAAEAFRSHGRSSPTQECSLCRKPCFGQFGLRVKTATGALGRFRAKDRVKTGCVGGCGCVGCVCVCLSLRVCVCVGVWVCGGCGFGSSRPARGYIIYARRLARQLFRLKGNSIYARRRARRLEKALPRRAPRPSGAAFSF